jgi:hypothetical protein
MAKPKTGKASKEGKWPARCLVVLPYALAAVFLGRTVICVCRLFVNLFTLHNSNTAEEADLAIWAQIVLGICYFVMVMVIAVAGTRLSEALPRARTVWRLAGLAAVIGLLVGLTTLWLATALLGKWFSGPADVALAAGVGLFEFLMGLLAGWPSLRARRSLS